MFVAQLLPPYSSEAAAQVRLRFQEGPPLQDPVEDGVVLFLVDGPVHMPATADILDSGGALLASHSTF